MTPEARKIKSVFFQARKMDVYEANPDLVWDLVVATHAAVQAEREAIILITKDYGHPGYLIGSKIRARTAQDEEK